MSVPGSALLSIECLNEASGKLRCVGDDRARQMNVGLSLSCYEIIGSNFQKYTAGPNLLSRIPQCLGKAPHSDIPPCRKFCGSEIDYLQIKPKLLSIFCRLNVGHLFGASLNQYFG
jgi:hypothetical protein